MSNELTTNHISDFVDGQKDCRDGVPADGNRSEGYLAGYGQQYEKEARENSNDYN